MKHEPFWVVSKIPTVESWEIGFNSSDHCVRGRSESILVTRPRITTLVLTLAWLQPLIIHRTGIPLASLLLGILGVLAVCDRLLKGSKIPILGWPASFGYAGLIWATLVVLSGSNLQNLTVWLTLFVAILLGPWVGAASLPFTRVVVLRSAEIGLFLAIVAVFLERFISASLFGLITEPQSVERAAALAPNPNAGALYLMVGLILVAALGHRGSSQAPARFVRTCLLVAGFWALIQTGSRGAMLGLACASIVGLFLYGNRVGDSRQSAIYRVLASALTGVCIAFYLGLLPQAIQERLSLQTRLGSTGDRFEIWRAATALIDQNPILGVSEFSAQGYGVNNAHNTILEAAIRYGLPGAVLLTLAFCSFLVLFYQRRWTSVMAWAGLLLLTATGIYSLSHTGILDNTYVWVVTGMLAFAAREGQAVVKSASPPPIHSSRP